MNGNDKTKPKADTGKQTSTPISSTASSGEPQTAHDGQENVKKSRSGSPSTRTRSQLKQEKNKESTQKQTATRVVSQVTTASASASPGVSPRTEAEESELSRSGRGPPHRRPEEDESSMAPPPPRSSVTRPPQPLIPTADTATVAAAAVATAAATTAAVSQSANTTATAASSEPGAYRIAGMLESAHDDIRDDITMEDAVVTGEVPALPLDPEVSAYLVEEDDRQTSDELRGQIQLLAQTVQQVLLRDSSINSSQLHNDTRSSTRSLPSNDGSSTLNLASARGSSIVGSIAVALREERLRREDERSQRAARSARRRQELKKKRQRRLYMWYFIFLLLAASLGLTAYFVLDKTGAADDAIDSATGNVTATTTNAEESVSNGWQTTPGIVALLLSSGLFTLCLACSCTTRYRNRQNDGDDVDDYDFGGVEDNLNA